MSTQKHRLSECSGLGYIATMSQDTNLSIWRLTTDTSKKVHLCSGHGRGFHLPKGIAEENMNREFLTRSR